MFSIPSFTFEDANKLDWADERITFVTAMRLLMVVYDDRPEAEPYRTRLRAIRRNLSDHSGNVNPWAAERRRAFGLQGYGVDRNKSRAAHRRFFNAITNDPLQAVNPPQQVLDASLECMNDLEELCKYSGLSCTWAVPVLYIDMASSLVTMRKGELAAPTHDGLLGPLFPRHISDTLKVEEPSQTLSDDKHPEWLLVLMSRDEMRRNLGVKHAEKVHGQLENWGYEHGHKWARRDFDMLFDRLFLKDSVQTISERYNWDKNTVQRNTHRLAQLLELDLPQAPDKPHRHN